MKRKWSFRSLLHNNRLMMIVSLVLAVAIWASVAYGPSNVKERALKITVDLDLSGTYAETIGLSLLDTTSYEVTVNVKGKWSVISALSANDINVRADYSALNQSGSQKVSFIAAYNSEVTDFDIVSVSPSSVQVNVDYWETGHTYKVTPDVSNVSVTDPQYLLGDAVIDSTMLPDGTVTLEGPRSVTSRVKSFVARIEEKKEITDVTVLPARLVALDSEGKEVDISACELKGLSSETVNVTVPVWESHTVEFTYTVNHLPGLFDTVKDALTVSPPSVVLVGPKGETADVALAMKDLGTFDFDNLLPENEEMKIPLNIPSGCTVLDNVQEVTLKWDIGSLKTRTEDVAISPDSGNVVFENLPAGMTASVPQQTLTGITLVGKNYTINNLSLKNLVVTVDMTGATLGTGRYEARVSVKNQNKVWTYYGEEAHGISVYVNVQ